jgi:stress response protein YsnF
MNTENSALTSQQQEELKKEIIQSLKIYDTHEHLLGDVKHILRDEHNNLQIVFAPPNQEEPLFRVSRNMVRKVDLEKSYLIIFLTKNMKQELFKHSHNAYNWIQAELSDDVSQNEALNSDSEMSNSSILDEATVRLLEERLTVKRDSRKRGEVVVRKVVETNTVEVPVRQEKLIVEQIQGDQTENLAEINLSSGKVKVEGETPQNTAMNPQGCSVHGEFITPDAASEILKAISLQKNHGCHKINIELVVSDAQKQQEYQAMFDRCTNHNSLNLI